MAAIEAAVVEVPTRHQLLLGDARLAALPAESVHLVVTSPPYWVLKEYRRADGQLGWIEDYEEFLQQLDEVWRKCHTALVPGGRLICVVGDVCLARRRNRGKHMVVPLHASIQEHCREIGFDNLAPIIWSKIANAAYEVDRGRRRRVPGQAVRAQRGDQERHRVHPHAAEGRRLPEARTSRHGYSVCCRKLPSSGSFGRSGRTSRASRPVVTLLPIRLPWRTD